MYLSKITMKVGEARLYTIDYSEWLNKEKEEEVLSVEVAISPPTVPGLQVTASVIEPLQQPATVGLLIEGGVADTDYVVSVKMTTVVSTLIGDINQIRDDCLSVSITEGCDA